MKNQKLSAAVEHDLKVAIRDGQKEIKEGFRTGKEPDWKAIEANMKSQLNLNPNTYQKHVDYADKRHISHCRRVKITSRVDSHNYDKYETFYKKDAGKYVVKNNIERMQSLWKKTKGKTSSERVAYYQKVKGVWDRRNRRSSKFITSRITEDASRENNVKTTGFVDLLNLGPNPCLECIALGGVHKAETAPKLPVHDHCYCEYRPGVQFSSTWEVVYDREKGIGVPLGGYTKTKVTKKPIKKKPAVKKPIKKKPIKKAPIKKKVPVRKPIPKSKPKPIPKPKPKPIPKPKPEPKEKPSVPVSKTKIRKGLEGETFKVDCNVPLNKTEDEIIRALQLRINPNLGSLQWRGKEQLLEQLKVKGLITVIKDGKEVAGIRKLHWTKNHLGCYYLSETGESKIVVLAGETREQTFVHELGHAVYSNTILENKIPKIAHDCWEAKSSYPRGPILSEYSLQSADEYFAESFSAYVREPMRVKHVDKKMYDTIKNEVFDGFEWI